MTDRHNMQILQDAAEKYGPLCVGLDTDPSYLPDSVVTAAGSDTEAVLLYNREIIRRIAADKSACCFKIQIAYYEAMGTAGMRVYAQTLKAVREAGFAAVSDVKRGDIANTAAAYARAHFSGDFESDIITVNPYMGFDTLRPFLQYCRPEKGGKGIFVLLRTSNPGMADIERQELKDGGRVLEKVGAELENISAEFASLYPGQGCSPAGAVVGCTEESDARSLRDACPDIFFLIPGYGAQGGEARIAATLLDRAGGVVNSSRGILCAWQHDAALSEKRGQNCLCMTDIADSAARAALAAKQDLLAARKSVPENG